VAGRNNRLRIGTKFAAIETVGGTLPRVDPVDWLVAKWAAHWGNAPLSAINADGSLKFPQPALQEERAALLSAARRIAPLDWNSHCGLEVEESVEPLRLQSGGTKDMLAKRLTLESTRNRAIRVHLGERLRRAPIVWNVRPLRSGLPSLSGAWLNGWKRKTAKLNKERLLAAPSTSTPACGAFRLWQGA
jgi:hypothetical protein